MIVILFIVAWSAIGAVVAGLLEVDDIVLPAVLVFWPFVIVGKILSLPVNFFYNLGINIRHKMRG